MDVDDGGPNPPGDDLTRDPPQNVPILGDNPWALSQEGPALQTQPYKEVCQHLKKELGVYLGVDEPDNPADKGHTGHKGPALAKRIVTYMLYRGNFEVDLPPMSRAAHPDLLPGAGKVVLLTATTIPAGGAMNVNVQQTTRDLAELDYRHEWLEALEWAPNLVRLNLAHTESRVVKTVTHGLGVLKGILPENGMLRDALKKAIKWAKLSAEKAQATLKDRQKTIAEHVAQSGGSTPATEPSDTGAGTAQGTGTGQGTVGLPMGTGGGDNNGVAAPGSTPATGHLPRPRTHKTTTRG